MEGQQASIRAALPPFLRDLNSLALWGSGANAAAWNKGIEGEKETTSGPAEAETGITRERLGEWWGDSELHWRT
jgi:hypothetical protein